jgi:hypothetical protein
VTQPVDPSPERHWVEPSGPQIERSLELYRLAYDEGKRSVDDQTSELANARTRAVQFLAFVGSATAFLVTRVVEIGDKPDSFRLWAGLATALAIGAIVLVTLVLVPWITPWERRVAPRDLLQKWIETDVPIASESKMLRELALHYGSFQIENERRLRRVRVLYIASIVAGALQVTVWGVVVSKYG